MFCRTREIYLAFYIERTNLMKSILVITLGLILVSPYSQASVHPNAKQICGEKSCKEVRHSLKRSAYRGNTFAQKLIALMYLDGLGSDVKPEKARKFLKMSVKQEDAMGALMLAQLYKGPLGNDAEKYEYWLQKAAEFSDEKVDSLRKMNSVLEAKYNPKNDLTMIAEKLRKAGAASGFGGGSHILGTSCNNSSKSSCRSHKRNDSIMTM